MSRLRQLSTIIIIALLTTLTVQPQQSTTTHFENEAVTFDHPAGWNATASSLSGEEVVTVAPKLGPSQIVVSSTSASSCDFDAQTKSLMTALVDRTALQIHSASAVRSAIVKTQFDAADVDGVRLQGVIKGKRVTADVFAVRRHLRFIGLVYVRVENDEAAAAAWSTVRTSLKVQPGMVFGVKAKAEAGDMPDADELDKSNALTTLNGRALSLPAPTYPPIARQAHAGGTVSVQVVIDETGAVISARAVEGHPLLQAVSVGAARQAQFSSTKLCDQPVRVTGVITYNFVPR